MGEPTSQLYDLAHAVHKHITHLPAPIRHLYLRPLNYQKPRQTSWWLVPDRQLSIYRFSKLFFHRLRFLPSTTIAGFSFERGLGGQLSDLVDSKLIMQSNWYWRRFLNDVAAGNITRSITTIKERLKAELYLAIEFFNFNKAQRRSMETLESDDILLLQITQDLDTLIIHRSQSPQLQDLNTTERCYDLVMAIEMDPIFSWYWLRMTLGVTLNPQHILDQENAIANLWRDQLSPWMPLVG
jgi:hypothetical protein